MTRRPSFPWSIDSLLPHAGPMLLLDGVVSCDEHRLAAEVTIRASQVFFQPEGVPGHVALEFMAQACGAFAGAEAVRTNEPVRLGLLLGTRDFETSRAWFREGEQLIVTATMVLRDAEMGVFDCRVEIGSETVASARLNVFQPSDLSAALRRHR